MALICLPRELADKVKKSIKTGILDPEKLKNMTSENRRAFLAKIVGEESSKDVNLLFEKKLLLKNQERAMYSWAKDITGLSKKQKEEVMAKIKATLEEKQRRIYDPKENEKFLDEITSDVFSKKYKTDISLDEAQAITKITSKIRESQNNINTKFKSNELAQEANKNITAWGDGSKADKLKYGVEGFGADKVALDNYVGNLKLEANKRPLIDVFKEEGIGEKFAAVGENLSISAKFIADNSRAVVASIDNSWWFRQGWKTLFNPKYTKIWAKNFIKSFDDIGKTLKGGVKKGDEIIDSVKAEGYSRKNFLNELYENKGGRLDLGGREEAFPTSAPSKIPILGRFFKASETAYEAAAIRMRMDIADIDYRIAEKMGVDLTNKFEVGAINKLVNIMTGRGRIAISEGSQNWINSVFFSIKLFKSNIDTLTMPFNPLHKTSVFARKQAALNLLSIIAGSGTILGMSNTLWPGSVDFDPRSSNFGKIKIKNTRFDVTGGMGSLITLPSRIITQSSKSATTDIVTELGKDYGMTGMDVLWNFTENKFSPMFSTIKHIMEQRTFEGEKPTIMGETAALTTPIIIQEWRSMKEDPNAANTLLGLIADGLGISVNTYSYKDLWEISSSKKLKQFKAIIGDKEFKEANDKYNIQVNEFMMAVVDDPDYELITEVEKRDLINDVRDKIKEDIFKEHDFEYKQSPFLQFEDGGEVENKKIIDAVLLYAEAIGKDPFAAFKTMFNEETLKRVDNNAVIVERMGEEDRWNTRIGLKATNEVELDHVMPLQLGGTNNKDNLELVPIEEHAIYTKVGNFLGRYLRDGTINRQLAQKLMMQVRNGERSAEAILNIKF